MSARHPVHLTVKIRRGLPSLRAEAVFRRVRRLLGCASKPGFAVAQWSVQTDHVHLIVEAGGRRALSSGMAQLDAALARTVNALIGRRGPVLRQRYHEHILESPTEVRRALVYVLRNAHKHGALRGGLDPLSSAPMFEGWSEPRVARAPPDATVSAPRTWLLRIGWRRLGLVKLGEVGASAVIVANRRSHPELPACHP